MRQFLKLFNKVGGLSVLSQYAKAHVLLFAIIQTLLQGFSNKSLEIVRLSVNNRLLCRLRRKYKRTVNEFVQLHKGKAFPRNRSNKDVYKRQQQISIEGDYDINTPGDYQLSYFVTDSDGNTSEVKTLTLTVKEGE